MSRSFDEVVREQAAVAKQLSALPADAFDERAHLRRRLRELRGEVIAAREAIPTRRKALLREKLDLQRRIAELDGRTPTGGRRSSSASVEAQELNTRIERANKRVELVRRLGEVEAMLDRMDGLEGLL